MQGSADSVAILGGGPGGLGALRRFLKAKVPVVCVDMTNRLGGVCLHEGCVPSKSLLHQTRNLGSNGKEFGIDRLMNAKNSVISKVHNGLTASIPRGSLLFGQAKFALAADDSLSLDVDQKDQSSSIKASHYIIATGSRPTWPSNFPPRSDIIASSSEALAWKAVPKKLLVIGGGIIGLEISEIWRRLGAEVVIVEKEESILSPFDHDVRKVFLTYLKRKGVKVMQNCEVQSLRESNGTVLSEIRDRVTGVRHTVDSSKCLVSVGRQPNTNLLDLHCTKVQADSSGRLFVGPGFRTTDPRVFAVGDVVANSPGLAHKAELEGEIAAEEILSDLGLGGKPHIPQVSIHPTVMYTRPEVAMVGATEDEMRSRNVKYRKGIHYLAANCRRWTDEVPNSEAVGFVKILEEENKVVGVTVVGPRAGEIINEGTLAVQLGLSGRLLANISHPHPTFGESFRLAAKNLH